MRVRTVLAVAGTADPQTRSVADLIWTTPAIAPRDHCAELAKQIKR